MSDGLVFVLDLARSREHLFRTDFFPYLCFTEGFEFQTFVVMKRREVDRRGDFLDGDKLLVSKYCLQLNVVLRKQTS